MKMATTWLIIFAAACVCANEFPQEPTMPWTRNTIFGDEKLEGEVFDNLKEFDLLETARRTAEDTSSYRLPKTTKPRHYDVLWEIDIEKSKFTGSVNIELHATRYNVNEIVIHASEINIESAKLNLNNVTINTFTVKEEETEFLRIKLVHATLQYSKTDPIIYRLTIYFYAKLRTTRRGIYQSWYRNNGTDEEIKWMTATQFQATSARRAFPCYDEPSFKATFDVIIRRPTDFKSWFCTRIADSRSAIAGYEDDIYHRTPVMSTYLLALIVADYETKEHFENGCLMYEVIARPGAMSEGQGDYAFDVGLELLAEMSDHTAIDFNSVAENLKMTLAVAPDFSANAMENWGLLIYKEVNLMYDEEHTNSHYKQVIATTLSHEIAHMWFGNLVTCDWWNVLWLNEGFARYYQYFLTQSIEGYMGLEMRFITEQVHTALLGDSANNPYALSSYSIGSPASVRSMFSVISYSKGASVIRQTEHLLGFKVHREGLRNYLVKKAFGTALPIDLFESLQNVSIEYSAISKYEPDFNVIDYYKSWTDQPGHPVLNVQVNHQTGEMTIYQRRFNINTGYSRTKHSYIIPITFATASNPDFSNTKPTHIIRKAVTTIQRGSIGDEWVVFNKQQTGFYRVNYDDYTWNLIAAALRTEKDQIHEYNRAQIVNDVFQFARSGLMTYTQAFHILSFLEFETEYAPWVTALEGFSWIRNRFAGTKYLSQLDDLIIRWSKTVVTHLTYLPLPKESFMTSYLRYQLAPTLCIIDAPNCRRSAVTQFAALRDNNTEVPVDSRNWVYCNALREGTVADFNFLWERFNKHNVYAEKIQLIMTLGCTPHAKSLNIFLDAIVRHRHVIRPQEYYIAWNSAVTGNEGNTQIVFQYVKDNLQAVMDTFGSATSPLTYISSRLRTDKEITAFRIWAIWNVFKLRSQVFDVYKGAATSSESIEWTNEIKGDFINYFKSGLFPLPADDSEKFTHSGLYKSNAAAITYVFVPVLVFAVMANFI